MKHFKFIYRLLIISVLLFNFSCREEIELETESFESVLVVEATITNELKRHEVKVSRTFLLEETEQVLENNAEVRVTDNTGNSFNFSQNSEGVYVSDSAFEALPNIEYTLLINTTDGKSYTSSIQVLTPISQIDNLYAEFVDDDINGQGIQVFVDSNNETSNAQYFRYEFIETYKLVAPFYYDFETLLTNYEEITVYNPRPDVQVFYDTDYFLKTVEQETCFRTEKNTELILGETSELDQNNLLRFPIRFIESDNGIIRDRYSILVKQYIQNLEAYKYYKIIDDLGNNGGVLSETQPGYIQGNLFDMNNPESKVIGYFDVSTVTEERIYFNHFDFNLQKPDYPFECFVQELDYRDNSTSDLDKNDRKEIYRLLTLDEEQNLDYHILEIPLPSVNTVWKIVNPECSDCRTVGTNIQPDFWVD